VAQMSISRCLTELATRDPLRPAVTDHTGSITRSRLDRLTNRLARAYAAMGVRGGDTVTVALPNGGEFVAACVAVWKLGATPQPLSSRLPAPEREAVVELAGPRLVVGAQAPGRTCVPVGYRPPADLDDGPLPDAVSAEWKMLPSGGSTGRPKLIAATVPGRFDPDVPAVHYLRTEDTQLVAGPLYHNGPFIYAMRGLFCGHHLVVMERFEARSALDLIDRHRIGFTMLVPTMMHRIWRLPTADRDRYDLSSLRTVLHLGAPCPPWLKRAWIDWLGPDRVLELYAGTEATGVTLITGQEWLARPGSVGRAALGSSVRVLDPRTGRDSPPGQVGEVYLMPATGPGSTYRYLGAQAKSVDGWETLGDLGWLDADGYLYLTDRSADLILTGGANVYPAEVEAALDSHPAVRSSAVIGLPDDDLGECVHAIVDAVATVTADQLREHVAQQLARYKVPRSVEFVSAPLRGDDGKVRRSQLRRGRLGGSDVRLGGSDARPGGGGLAVGSTGTRGAGPD
jgi:bile acid-coenzyme A ligase